MKRSWSDEEITAFLDGEMAPREAARIRAGAGEDRALARRIEALSLDREAVASAFDALLDVARSRDLGRCLEAGRGMAQGAAQGEAGGEAGRSGRAGHWRSRWAWPASLAAALAAGGVLAWALMPAPGSDWRIEVAHYQALYVPETLSPITPDSARLQEEFARAGKAIGLDLGPEELAGIAGLELRRAQVLGYRGAPLVQIAYSGPDGTPVAFCIIRREGVASPPESDVLIGLAAASWSSPTHGYLVIGGDDPEEMLTLARELRRRLEGG